MASNAAPRVELALDVLTTVQTMTAREGRELGARLDDGDHVWAAAEASFSAECDSAGVGVSSVYDESFEVGAALDNLTATAAASPLPRGVIEVMVTCVLATMNPECAQRAGQGVYQSLATVPIVALMAVTGR